MAKLSPFKALRYNPAKVRDLGVAVAPPYDIISPKEQEFYYDLNPYNVIRLDFGKTTIFTTLTPCEICATLIHMRQFKRVVIGDVTNAPQTYMLDGHQYVICATGDMLWSFLLY